ncbi:MAG TPA: TonB-dependent receptor [Steroidobacteraceae bacterium]|jgi:outer membrane receptor protein involved in Fe transport
MSSNLSVRQAVGLAVGAAGAAAGSVGYISAAQAADQGPVAAAPDATLSEVVVTGSRIRTTVDEATAAPITVIDSATITATGFQTAGDLMQQLPGVSGAPTTPAVNNGGGFGESNVELRGLDAKRTLVLLDGRRIGVFGGPGTSGAVDINQIPLNIIDHVDVLKEGAGAVYGSDAIAGVVNFVTRKGVQDLELTGEYGRTTKNDGEHQSFGLMWGGSTDKLDFVISGNYNKQKAVYAGSRNFSKDSLYLYSGSSGRFVSHAGSSRVPYGRASIPSTSPLSAAYGCANVTRTPGTDGTSTADYTCLHGSYNYQPFNLLMTPQERGAIFTSTTYHINDDVEIYASFLNNKTHSGFEIAPLPFDATADDVVISAANQYNPFGLDFGGLDLPNSNYRTRFVTLGDRFSKTNTDTKVVNFGLKGKLPVSDWQWDLNLSYNREDQKAQTFGYVYFPGLQNEVGPSFQNPDGSWGCGTDAAHAIAGCTPINFFDLNSPATIAALKDLNTSYNTDSSSIYKAAALDFNGTVMTLPAGDLRAAVGFQYQDQKADYNTDYLIHAAAPLYIKCLISQEACSGDSAGGYSSKELYAEALVPILKDLPGVNLLNLDVGVRYSDYSLFGSTTKFQGKLEYKPVKDVLLRGTFAQVFRAPTLIDLYAAPLNTSATFSDPCYGSTPAAAAANPNLAKACNGAYQVVGGYSYPGTAQITGVITSNPNLKPETGHVWTTGFVVQVPFVPNLSVTADYWNYDIKNIITQLDPNYSIQQCLTSGAAQFCDLVHRYLTGNNQGQIEVFALPNVNLGELKTNGVDADINYKLSNTPVGSFKFDLSGTFINKYESISLPGSAPLEIAGTYDRQFGNYAKFRGLGQVQWSMLGFEGLFSVQYINHMVIKTPATQNEAIFGQPNPDLEIPSIIYFNMTLGYNVAATKTKVQLGMQNIGDKQPPIMYQNNVTNANTDVSTYDTLGRRWFVSFLQKF